MVLICVKIIKHRQFMHPNQKSPLQGQSDNTFSERTPSPPEAVITKTLTTFVFDHIQMFC